MSFGYSVNDVLALIQLSWRAVEGARHACGKHDDLAKELWSLYDVLAHVYSEMSVPESVIGGAREERQIELENHIAGCETQLRIINTVLDKFNALSPEQRCGKLLWPEVRFANGESQDLAVIRSRMSTYSTAISMSLSLMSLGSRGKVERQLSRQKGALEGIRESVNFALAHLNSKTRAQTLMAAYLKDPKSFWRSLRREILKDDFKKAAVQGKKDLIISYMKELDSRRVLGYSISFQKELAREKDAQQSSRQSRTPSSSRSDSTYADSRSSNTSLQCVEPSKCGGQGLDEPVCIRTSPWPESRSLTAVAFDPKYPQPGDGEDEGYQGSPKIPYRVRHETSTEGWPTLYDEAIDMPTESESFDNTSHLDLVETAPQWTSMSHHASMSSVLDQKIKFEDPHGREFSFPLSQAKTWEVRNANAQIISLN